MSASFFKFSVDFLNKYNYNKDTPNKYRSKVRRMTVTDEERFFEILERRIDSYNKILKVKVKRTENVSEDDSWENIWEDIAQLGNDCIHDIQRYYEKHINKI